MRINKAVLALLVGGLLLPVAGSAGRLDGVFSTQDSTTGLDNEACMVLVGPFMGAAGEVTATNGPCQTFIRYATDEPHKANATALKGSKNKGNGKVSQSIFTYVEVETVDAPAQDCPAANEYFGSTDASEKCKASANMSGSSVSEGDDTVDKQSVNVNCELGQGLGNLSPAPDSSQSDTIFGAFGDRKDVKLKNDKKGKLTIKHKGIPATTPVFCSFD
jgi:hypothetical protein